MADISPFEAAAMAVANDDKNWQAFSEDFRNDCRKAADRVLLAYFARLGWQPSRANPFATPST